MSAQEEAKQRSQIRDRIVQAAELLCKKGRRGTWGDARNSGTAIWALCNCGLAETHNQFITHCVAQLLNRNEVETSAEGLSFNRQVWDTSFCLIAIYKGAMLKLADKKTYIKEPKARSEFRSEFEDIRQWLARQYNEDNEDNINNEPWETLWALYALMLTGNGLSDNANMIKSCIPWLLDRRNPDGILISPHYMGLLLAVLNQALNQLHLTDRERSLYDDSAKKCISYLMTEFDRCKNKGSLWDNEPWSIGMILLGISNLEGSSNIFFQNNEFNDFLVHWSSDHWDPSIGWIDLLDTTYMLIGLANYYIERETYLRSSEAAKENVLREIAKRVDFKFQKQRPFQITAYPIWHTERKKLEVKNRQCLILMPFEQPWSSNFYDNLYKILHDLDFAPTRADKLSHPDVIKEIWKGINTSEIVIVEITGQSANVFYELGIVHTLGKDVIILVQNQDRYKIPFDIHGRRFITYTDDPDGYIKLKEDVRKALNAILKAGYVE